MLIRSRSSILTAFVAALVLLLTAEVAHAQITPIHDIQGPGAASPINGSTVTIRGIVTGVKADGFFVQEEDAEVDADPATSEGIFVFTSSAPPVAAAFSARVEVTGTVAEFVPSSDPLDPPSTQLTSPTVVQILPPGQTLPSVVELTPAFPSPAGPFDQLERVEGMRVRVPSLTVTGPSRGTVDEAAATGTSDGRFYGVVAGVARPFREAGVQAPDPVPSGTIPPIPRWDSSPERLGIDSAAINGQPIITVKSGDIVDSLEGPLDYRSRAYAILPDGTSTLNVTPGTLTTTVTNAAGNQVTVASINLRRLFDTVDDPYGDQVLTAPAYANRLAKASIAIRAHLLNPDIIGVQEVEKLSVLNDLAARIQSDGGPAYAAYLTEGNDTALGLDVGFLVKTDLVTGGVPRVSVTSVNQISQAVVWTDPRDLQNESVFEHPPLVLEATVNRSSASSFPIVVIVTDLFGLSGIDSLDPDGLTTVGNYVRQKRRTQAQVLADRIQLRQLSNPAEHLVVIGGFNAFEVNDGFVDVMNTVIGTPSPDNQTVVAADGTDLVDPDLVNLVATPPAAERYSDVFEGNARNVDHALVNAPLVAATSARRIEHPRIAADYPETELDDNTTALRFSDRDPVVAYFTVNGLTAADLEVTKVDTPDPVTAGHNLTYTMTVTNNGPDLAVTPSLSDTLPPGTTFVSLTWPEDWSCTTPAVGEDGPISCSRTSMGVVSEAFTLVVAVDPSVAAGTVLSNTVTVSSPTTADPTPGNNSATAMTTVDGSPTITDITNQTIGEDTTTGALPFTIGDVATPAANLAIAVGSSDQTLVPNANIVVGGAGANRTITVIPAANRNGGPVTITVTVTDGALLSVSDTFTVTVTAVNDAPTITAIAPQSDERQHGVRAAVDRHRRHR